MAEEKDHIGPDPVKWIERLRDVNEKSSFTRKQKLQIDVKLDELMKELEQELDFKGQF